MSDDDEPSRGGAIELNLTAENSSRSKCRIGTCRTDLRGTGSDEPWSPARRGQVLQQLQGPRTRPAGGTGGAARQGPSQLQHPSPGSPDLVFDGNEMGVIDL